MKFKKLKVFSTLPSRDFRERSPESQGLADEVNATGKWVMVSTNAKDFSQARRSFPDCTVVLLHGNVWIGPKEAK